VILQSIGYNRIIDCSITTSASNNYSNNVGVSNSECTNLHLIPPLVVWEENMSCGVLHHGISPKLTKK